MYDNYAIAWKPPPAHRAGSRTAQEQAAAVAAAARELVPWLATAARVALGSTQWGRTADFCAHSLCSVAPWRERFL